MNRLIIRGLYALTSITWYLFLVFVVIITIGICIKIFTGQQLEWDVPVIINASKHLPVTGMNTNRATVASLRNVEGLMQFKVRLTPLLTANVIFFYSLTMFLVGSILFHARRIFKSLKADIPFNAENVKRLRYIGLFVIAMAVINFIDMIFKNILFKAQLQQAGNLYHIKMVLGCWPVATGLVILVLSEVFRKGYQLKVDNESFV
ncbi:MAG TPA: DUF2975 domain-containing protein [Chitinophaga sp.]|uniref:DUF2975 domain-containing protein n=1 Tax=Chitinophaga sp. TaxID=1869181 RepID=UPI002DBFEBDF|nr:DUF2975 domain-containing protein [Chitinophaga sp.]HEU4551478.1 DUF2975 domain-containing protein [Chitinophaga sp.]